MKYITFVSRDPWPAINSLYGYIRLKHEYFKEIIILYSSWENAMTLEHKISTIYGINQKEFSIEKIRIEENVEELRKVLDDIVSEGDVVDITGARKSMILALLDLKNIKIVYLFLKDMRFSKHPFIMRPLSLQEIMEVQR